MICLGIFMYGLQSAGATCDRIAQGAVNSASRKTPPVRRMPCKIAEIVFMRKHSDIDGGSGKNSGALRIGRPNS